MEKHDIVLESLYKRIQDDLDDGYAMYHDATKMKEHGEMEMSRFTIADAKARTDHADIIKDKISDYKKKNNINDTSECKSFYCYVLEKIDELKTRISKFSV